MPRRFSRSRLTRAALTMLLMVALVCVQWIGLKHKIVHGNWQQNLQLTSTATDPGMQVDWEDKSRHSCAAFDAATLADSVSTLPFVTPLLPNLHVLALWVAFASWDAPFTCNFSSRAPPQA